MPHIAGMPIKEYCEICNVCDYQQHHREIAAQVRDSAYHIIGYKGSTFYGIGLSLIRISAATLRNERSVLTVSTLLKGDYGISDLCLGVPCIVGQDGVDRIVAAQLSLTELRGLERSAAAPRRVLGKIQG
jgi:L-lactate dehydrogenase